MIILISTFAILQNNKIEKFKNQNSLLTKNLESVVNDTLLSLYNDDLSLDSTLTNIDDEFKESILKTFSIPNKTLKDTEIYLNKTNLSKTKIYKKRHNHTHYVLYTGVADFTWNSKNDNTLIDKDKKQIKVYLKKEKDSYYITNLEIKDID